MELGIREGGYDSTKMEFPSVRSDSIRLDSARFEKIELWRFRKFRDEREKKKERKKERRESRENLKEEKEKEELSISFRGKFTLELCFNLSVCGQGW